MKFIIWNVLNEHLVASSTVVQFMERVSNIEFICVTMLGACTDAFIVVFYIACHIEIDCSSCCIQCKSCNYVTCARYNCWNVMTSKAIIVVEIVYHIDFSPLDALPLKGKTTIGAHCTLKLHLGLVLRINTLSTKINKYLKIVNLNYCKLKLVKPQN